MGNPYNKEKLLKVIPILHDLFLYDEKTGLLKWKIKRSAKAQKGTIAGSISKSGYIHVSINSQNFYVHQIIWMMFNNRIPCGEVDHINFNRSDNRIENLRELPSSESIVHRKLLKKNTSGFTGVCWKKSNNKWQAKIGYMGQSIYLGLFETAELAHKARLNAEHIYYPNLFPINKALEESK